MKNLPKEFEAVKHIVDAIARLTGIITDTSASPPYLT
jgi:hypothetical protein